MQFFWLFPRRGSTLWYTVAMMKRINKATLVAIMAAIALLPLVADAGVSSIP